MRPSRYLLRILLGWLAFGLLVFLVRVFSAESLNESDMLASEQGLLNVLKPVWDWSSCALILVALFDLFRHRSFTKLDIQRELPHSLALGVPASVFLRLENPLPFSLKLEIVDMLPGSVEAPELPLNVLLEANSYKKVSYPIFPVKRGEALFGPTKVRILTRWKLWQRMESRGDEASLKVYPNFAPIASSAAIGLEHQIAQLGIHLQQRRGEGSDFHQLREFRQGDALRQIDWKATARYRKPISREYQDERDQDIVFLLDCGRRLRNKDDYLSHFDHAMNALLLTAYIALRQGDAVGLMSFSGESRWMTPLKGPARINMILNQLYDLDSTTATSDYLKAAEDFMQKWEKRALVVIISNIRDEDLDDLAKACQLLSKKHIVMVASLRDVFLDKLVEKPVENFDDAMNYCGVTAYARARKEVLARLQGMGVVVTDSLPYNLHINLVNEYFKLKRSGRL